MMIPAPADGCIDRYNNVLKQYFEKDNVGVDFYEAGIVMVSAKEDSWRSKTNAVHVFHAIYDMFLLRMSCLKGRYLIRLLVPAAHTKKLIVLQTINSHSHKPVIYLTDNIPFLSSGDVIIEVEEDRRHIDEIMLSVYSDLREFRVDESMVFELKATNGIHPSNRVMSAHGFGMKLRRHCKIYSLSCKAVLQYTVRMYVQIDPKVCPFCRFWRPNQYPCRILILSLVKMVQMLKTYGNHVPPPCT
ncbi:unnamed protein product [Cuscuta campestris]|uniref:Uncharacterized protein n=1 Tax=Cuscuta campestris TaxID=132261 RepID=A0A484N6S0_9ASTE|nr:unnamed protein product [Cuscuta campestris]